MTTVPNSKVYEKVLSAGGIITSPYGLVRPVEVAIIRHGIAVPAGFTEGNLRAHVRRQASKARQRGETKSTNKVPRVVGGSLDGVVDRVERMNRFNDRYKDRSWKCHRSAQYKPVSCEVHLDS